MKIRRQGLNQGQATGLQPGHSNAAEQARVNRQNSESESDQVTVGKSTLDPMLLADERRKKVEELKKLVQSGNYNPDSSKVAQAFAEEVSFDVMDAKRHGFTFNDGE